LPAFHKFRTDQVNDLPDPIRRPAPLSVPVRFLAVFNKWKHRRVKAFFDHGGTRINTDNYFSSKQYFLIFLRRDLPDPVELFAP